MSIFSSFRLNEIQFSNESNAFPPEYDSTSKIYDLPIRRYPSNLGTSGTNHYMVFEIFMRENSNPDLRNSETDFIPGNSSNLDPLSYQITKLLSRTIGNVNISQQIRDQSAIETAGDIASGTSGNFTQSQRTEAMSSRVQQAKDDVKFSIPRLKKTKEVIALYMPDAGLQFNYAQNYDTASATGAFGAAGFLGQLGMAGAGAYSKFSSGGGFATPLKQLSPFAVEALTRALNDQAAGIVMSNFGVAINPSFEVIFSGSNLRNFSFDFMFYPRNEKEAEEVYRIIQAFKFHSAPEITKGTAGRYLLAPSAFDIKFYYNGQENPNIPKISTCVCNSINVDYAPSGFSAYEVQGENNPRRGRTGTPVATRLTLQFTETTMITKELIRGSILNQADFLEGAF